MRGSQWWKYDVATIVTNSDTVRLILRHAGQPVVEVQVSGTVFELFDVECYHDVEIWVKGHLRSCKPAPLESFCAVLHSPFIVTMALSCISSEI